jgi:hypothetical protein
MVWVGRCAPRGSVGIALALLIVVAPLPHATARSSWTTRTLPWAGISVSYPSAWKDRTEKGFRDRAFDVGPRGDIGRGIAVLSRTPASSFTWFKSDEEFTAFREGEIRHCCGEPTTLSVKALKVGDRPAFRYTGRYEFHGFPELDADLYIFAREGLVLWIMVSVGPGERQLAERLLDGVRSSA